MINRHNGRSENKLESFPRIYVGKEKKKRRKEEKKKSEDGFFVG
jgi:hypothetical protein